MPRSRPPRTVVLHLPPLPNAAGGSTTSAAPASTVNGAPGSGSGSAVVINAEPDFEVLIAAHKIAKKRGEVFNFRDFMSQEKREELDAEIRRVAGPSRLASPGAASVRPQTPATHPGPSESTPPASNAGPSLTPHDISSGLLDVPNPLTPQSISSPSPMPITPAPPDTPAANPSDPSLVAPTPTPAPKRYIPDLSGLHWKQRQKLKAQMDAEEAEAKRREAAGEPPIPASESVFAAPEAFLGAGTGAAASGWGRREKSAITPGDWEKTQGNTSYWNSLLNSARKQRGPQWDYNTQMYQINRSSADYYTHRQPPRPDSPKAIGAGVGISETTDRLKTESGDPFFASSQTSASELKRKRESTDDPSFGLPATDARRFSGSGDDRVALGEAIRRMSQASQGQGQMGPGPSPVTANLATSAFPGQSSAGTGLGTPVRTSHPPSSSSAGLNGLSTPGGQPAQGVPPRLSSLPPHLQAQLQAQMQAQLQAHRPNVSGSAATGSIAAATSSPAPAQPQAPSQFHGLTPQQLAQLQNLSLPSGMNAQGVQQALASLNGGMPGLNGMTGMVGMNGMNPSAVHGGSGQGWGTAAGTGGAMAGSGGINPAALAGAGGGVGTGFDPRELQKHVMRANGGGGDGPMLGGGGSWEVFNNN